MKYLIKGILFIITLVILNNCASFQKEPERIKEYIPLESIPDPNLFPILEAPNMFIGEVETKKDLFTIIIDFILWSGLVKENIENYANIIWAEYPEEKNIYLKRFNNEWHNSFKEQIKMNYPDFSDAEVEKYLYEKLDKY